MILSSVIVPKTKAQLIAAIGRGSFRSFSIFEGPEISKLPTPAQFVKDAATVIVLKP